MNTEDTQEASDNHSWLLKQAIRAFKKTIGVQAGFVGYKFIETLMVILRCVSMHRAYTSWVR